MNPVESENLPVQKESLTIDLSGSPMTVHSGEPVRVKQALAVATEDSEHYIRLRRIVTALTQLGMMQFVAGIGGLVRNKVMAVYLSPSGFGEFAQLTSIAATVWVFVQFGMAVGLSRNTAAAGDDEERQLQLSTANLLTLFLAFGTLALLVPLLLSSASNSLLVTLGVHPGFEEKMFLVILLSVAPIEALRSNYVSFLQGVVDIKGLSAKRSLAILASTATAVPLIAAFKVTGACVQTVFAAFFLALLLGMRCRTLGYRPLGISWDRRTAATLTTFGGACLLSGFANSATDALVRAHLISTAGLAENGFYQAAFSLSSLVTAVILGSVGAYSLATLSQTRDRHIVASRMEELLRVALPTATISLGCLGLFSQPILSTLFSPAFNQAAKYLPLLLLANYVQSAAWVAGAPLLGFGLIRAFIVIQIAGVALRYTSTVALTPFIGVYSVPAGFLAAMAFDLVAGIVVCNRNIKLRIDGRLLLPLSAGGIAILSAASAGFFVHHFLEYVAAFCVLVCIVATMAWPEVKLALDSLKRRIIL
jgi:O-antigen/teichoic acid export membrane protein